MSRLNDLYKAMETLKKEGLPVGEELERKASNLEEEIIKKEILPFLTKTIEPALQPVKRELVLVVDYIPGEPLTVHLSRKRNITSALQDAKAIVLDPVVEHKQYGRLGQKRVQSNPTADLSVLFPDGTFIAESRATDTFVAAIKKIGVARVREAVERHGIVVNNVLLITNRRDSKYQQKELGGGWLLGVQCNTLKKKMLLEKISSLLHLGLKVDIKQ